MPFLLPDIPGAVQRGKEFRFNNEMNALKLNQVQGTLDRQQQVQNMLSQLPDTQMGDRAYLGKMQSLGPEGMQTASDLQKTWAGLSAEDKQKEIEKGQKVSATLKLALQNPMAYQNFKDQIARFAPKVAEQLPPQFDPNEVKGYIARVDAGIGKLSGVASIDEYKFRQSLPGGIGGEEDLAFLAGKWTNQIVNLGRTKKVLGPDGKPIAEYTVTPKTTETPDYKAQIETAVAKARETAKAQGTNLSELQQAQAALPGLLDVVDQLKSLAPKATYTTGGRVWNAAVKEIGFGATPGATARASFISIVNNQVLPLLKPTFGAAFTQKEGDTLKETMGDPNATPEEKIAALEAFIQGKYRDIETKARMANVSSGIAKSADDQALEWAQSHPDDPRSKDILKALGK